MAGQAQKEGWKEGGQVGFWWPEWVKHGSDDSRRR